MQDQRCNFLETCCFFRRARNSTALIWKSQVESYCHGPLFSRCERRQIYLETGKCPPEHIIPSGEVPEIFLQLR